MTNNQPEWQRLQKALSVEADRGFNDIQGSQYRFSEFLGSVWDSLQLLWRLFARSSQTTHRWIWHLPSEGSRRAPAFDRHYGQFSEAHGASLGTRDSPPAWTCTTSQTRKPRRTNRPSSFRSPNSTPEFSSPTPGSDSRPRVNPHRRHGANGNRLVKLGLYTVYDLLYYYPRNHIDYAKQVQIRELVAGETVTLIAEVKRCNCFSSPKNKKLTILEVILKDRTGEIKISRFFSGPRYSNRGWQEFKKREYCTGAVLAASGLVKQGKYGITLENPELEVLDDSEVRSNQWKSAAWYQFIRWRKGWMLVRWGDRFWLQCRRQKCCQNRYQRICASVTV